MWKSYPRNKQYLVSDKMCYDTKGRYYQIVNSSYRSDKTKIGYKPLYGSNKSGSGYYAVHLGRMAPKEVHRIVAETFIGINDVKEVDHIDDNKFNNNLSNLRYVNRNENMSKPAWHRRQMQSQQHSDLYAVNIKTRQTYYFRSMNECAKELKVDRKAVAKAISKKEVLSAGGFVFITPSSFSDTYVSNYIHEVYHLRHTPVFSIDDKGVETFYPGVKATGCYEIMKLIKAGKKYKGKVWGISK